MSIQMIELKMNYLCLCLAILSQTMLQILAIRYRSDEIVSPCDDPQIYTADRMRNNSVRIYRGKYYWELNGLPDRKGFLSGPYKIWYPEFDPVGPNTKVVTVLGSGDRIGRITRVEGRAYKAWLPSGKLEERGDLRDVPHGGLKAIFHNDNQVEPMLIGLESIYVRYFTSKAWKWPGSVGEKAGYVGGNYGENFPKDVTAAFSYPSSEKDVEYYVYLFKKDKYCFRANKLTNPDIECEEWHSNKELFGCDSTPIQPPVDRPPPPPEPEGPKGGTGGGKRPPPQPANEKSVGSRVEISFTLICLIVICYCF